MPQTESIDRLFLELSQFTQAETHKEKRMKSLLMKAFVALSNSTTCLSVRDGVAKQIQEFLDAEQ